MLARAHYGVIEMIDGRLAAIHLRPWPKIISSLEIAWLGQRWHQRRRGDRCLIYYNQPRRYPNFLVLKYTVSQRGTTLATFQRGLAVLDEIARLKRSDAILCDVCNLRISDRLLARWGWQPQRQPLAPPLHQTLLGRLSTAAERPVGALLATDEC